MATAQELPEIQTAVGWKTTTVRLQQAQFEEAELFARALNLNMTDFVKEAVEHYVVTLAQDERVVKQAKRQLVRLSKMMEKIAARGDSSEEDEE